jgi:hypothetical protein
MRHRRHLWLAIAAALGVQGCMTAQTYDGPKLARDEVARIVGDMRFTAGAPISVVLRQVDERTLSLGQNSVDVLPGKHSVLVDCRIQATTSITRHRIEQDFFAGRTYRLIAETGPGVRECTAVHVEATD